MTGRMKLTGAVVLLLLAATAAPARADGPCGANHGLGSACPVNSPYSASGTMATDGEHPEVGPDWYVFHIAAGSSLHVAITDTTPDPYSVDTSDVGVYLTYPDGTEVNSDFNAFAYSQTSGTDSGTQYFDVPRPGSPPNISAGPPLPPGTYYLRVSGDAPLGPEDVSYRLDVTASPNVVWPYQAPPTPTANPCSKAFPRAHTTHIGRTDIHNYQSSVRMVDCYEFGVNKPKFQIHPTAPMLCGMVASASGWSSAKAGAIWREPNLGALGPATDGTCSAAEVTGSDSTVQKVASLTCSWAADLLGAKTPSPGFFAGVGCASAPAVGNALGTWWETGHEHRVALAVTRSGRCIKYSPRHFPSPWLAISCSANDPRFS